MNQPKFNLKSPSETESLIYLIFRYEGRKLKLSTGLKVPTKFWNQNKMRVKNNNQFPKYALYNQILEKYSNAAKESYLELLNEEQNATNGKLTKRINEKVNGTPKNTNEKGNTLHSFLDQYLENKKADNSLRPKTIQNYEKIIRLIKMYEKSKHFNMPDIDKDFHLGFKQFLFNTKFKKGKNKKGHYQPNYIARLITSYRGIMDTAFSKKLIKDRSFTSKDLSVSTVETDSIYLNENEIEVLRQLDLSHNLRLEKARDLFLIECYTGLRYSDIEKLSMNQVSYQNGKAFLTVPTIKTNKNVVIPLRQYVIDIINRYDGFPEAISPQKFNDYIKEVCQTAEMNDQVLVRKHIKSKVIPEYKPKWELVTSHTGRRSFATNAYLNGIPSIKIMKITGHKKESTFMKYIRISEIENAMDLADSDFFK